MISFFDCNYQYEWNNKLLLAGDKFMPEMHLKNLDLLIVSLGHLLKLKKEFKNLKKQEIQNMFTEMNYMKLFSTWYDLSRF